MNIASIFRLPFIFLLIVGVQMECKGGVVRPIIDHVTNELPKKFRTSHDDVEADTNTYELRELSISGSGQFSKESLLQVLDKIPVPSSQVTIIDLREESHGFVNSYAISWTDSVHNHGNRGKELGVIEADEFKRFSEIEHEKVIQLGRKESQIYETWVVESSQTEQELAESLGLDYVRLPVSDHCRPSDKVVDLFIQTLRSVSSDQWIHFHCRGGSGRTTTFMVLYDMLKNSDNVSLKDILKRHHELGGKDLTDLDKRSVKYLMAKERLEFVEKFYDYCRQNCWKTVSWLEWLQQTHES